MPTNIEVKNIKYFNQLTNGADFSLNTGDFSRSFSGNAGERIKFTCDIWLSYRSGELNDYEFVAIDADNFRITRTDQASFLDDGLRLDDEVIFVRISTTWNGILTYVSDKVIEINSVAHGLSSAIFTGPDTVRGDEAQLFSKYAFGLVTDQFSTASQLDGTQQAYLVSGVGAGSPRDTTFQTGETQGLIKSWVNGDIKIRYVEQKNDVLFQDSSTPRSTATVQVYEIEHEFIITPYTSNADYEGELTLKHVFELFFRTTAKQADTEKSAKFEGFEGNIGYFGENFNGFGTQYSVSNVVITRVSDSKVLDRLDGTEPCEITLEVNSADSTFSTSQPVSIYHSKIATEDEYFESTKDFETLFVYDDLRTTIDGAIASSSIIQDVDVNLVNASQISVTFKIDASGSPEIQNDDDYKLWLQVADDTLTAVNSDRTALIIDENQYNKVVDIPGLMALDSFLITDIIGNDNTNYVGCVEDSIRLKIKVKTDLTKGAVIDSWRIGTFAYNDITEDFFEIYAESLPSSFLDLEQAGIPVPKQIIDFEDQKTVLKSTTFDSTFQSYEIEKNIIVPYRGNVIIDAPQVFFDSNKENNGLNQNASNYSSVNGYEVVFGIVAKMNTPDAFGLTEYLIINKGNSIFNYETMI